MKNTEIIVWDALISRLNGDVIFCLDWNHDDQAQSGSLVLLSPDHDPQGVARQVLVRKNAAGAEIALLLDVAERSLIEHIATMKTVLVQETKKKGVWGHAYSVDIEKTGSKAVASKLIESCLKKPSTKISSALQ